MGFPREICRELEDLTIRGLRGILCNLSNKETYRIWTNKRKYEDNEIFWPDEKLFDKVIWKYKIEFKKLGIVDDWSKGTPVPQDTMLNTGRKVTSKELFCNMLIKIFKNLDADLLTTP